MRAWWVSVLLVPLVATSGCIECEPERVTLDISLHVLTAEAHALPMLASGATLADGVPAPDSHGRFTFEPHIVHKNISRVTASGLDIAVQISGENVPIKVVHTEGLGSADIDLPLEGTLREDRPVTIWWRFTTEHVEAPAGAAYTILLGSDWLLRGCMWHGDGTARGAATDTIMAGHDAQAFAARGTPMLSRSDAGTTMNAAFSLTADSERRIVAATGFVADASSGASAVFTDMAIASTAANRSVAPGDRIELEARGPVSMAGAGTGPFVVVIHIDHRGDGEPVRDAFAFLIR